MIKNFPYLLCLSLIANVYAMDGAKSLANTSEFDEQVGSYETFCQLFPLMKLDDESLREFIHNKNEIIEEGKEAGLGANNNLFAAYSTLSDIRNLSIIKRDLADASVVKKLKKLEAIVLNHPEYRSALKHAKKENTEEAWKAWRYKGGDGLVKQKLIEKGIVYPEPRSTLGLLQANQGISEKTADWFIAHSMFLYKQRQFQRHHTGHPLPPIKIRSTKP